MYVPEDLTDLLDYIDTHQGAGVHLVANGSDLINRIQRRQVTAKVLIDLSGLSEYNYVRKEGNTIRIGALTTIAELVASPIIDSHHEVFREVARKFGGPSIRNVATIGGNICSASSSEDLLPVLLALDAQVRLKSKRGERILRLEDFIKGKRLTDLRPNEIFVETMFQELNEQSTCHFEKLGMRNSLIIAFVSAAVYLKLEKKSMRVDDIRIAFNRVASKIPGRARKSEEKLRGTIISQQAIEDTVSSLRNELHLTSDFRVTGEYRSDVDCVLFKRALKRCVEKLGGEPHV
jgi:CO/xanthine dehydrogenase FAD-binding subunit